MAQIPDKTLKANAASNDLLLIRDLSSNTDKRVPVSGLATAVVASIGNGQITSSKTSLSIYGINANDVAPVAATSGTVGNSSVTFTVDAPSKILITLSANQQRNVGDTQTITVIVDGASAFSIVAKGNSGSPIYTTSKTRPVDLAAGSHTIRLDYAANSINNGVMNDISWYGLVTGA